MTDEEIDEECELSNNSFPKCPYCKHENRDDLLAEEDNQRYEMNCDSCSKTFEVTVDITISFSTSKIVG